MSRERTGKGPSLKPCCMISEVLEEAGVDRAQLRLATRQVLEGAILLCQWQLARMDEPAPAAPRARAGRGRRVPVE